METNPHLASSESFTFTGIANMDEHAVMMRAFG